MKLISMTDFVLQKERFEEDSDTCIFKITNYANFIKQTITIGMFVPCDEYDNILPESHQFLSCEKGFRYQKAKNRVLFKGFELKEVYRNGFVEIFNKNTKDNIFFPNLSNIESLSRSCKNTYCLTLTDSAIKQLA